MRFALSILILTCLSTAVAAQTSLDEVSYDAIPYRKVRNYLQKQKDQDRVCLFADLKPTCSDDEDLTDYSLYSKTYIVKDRIQKVWNTYVNSSPNVAWKTRKSAVALIYDRNCDEIVYQENDSISSDPGLIMYMNLKLAKGLYHLATALEITQIKQDEALIELSYVDHGVNQGKQWITMSETPEGYTIITHTSAVKSESHFRDKVLYPYFHNKLINAFHKNMKRRVYAAIDEPVIEVY